MKGPTKREWRGGVELLCLLDVPWEHEGYLGVACLGLGLELGLHLHGLAGLATLGVCGELVLEVELCCPVTDMKC